MGTPGVKGKKVSAASARAHTRTSKQTGSSQFFPRMIKNLLLVLVVGILAWAYQGFRPHPPKLCGSVGGPPITAPRIKLKDGRHLAYNEYGKSKDAAKFKIVFIHGFDSCRHDAIVATYLSPEIFKELGIYIVAIDRPGYGESDPHPKRTLESLALDIEELADQLGLGSKFYVMGYSMGGALTWGCLKYIPHRLAGAVLLGPVVNYWWPGFPSNLSTEAYYQQAKPDQWALRVSHYVPWLTYWWNTQKFFPGSTVIAHDPDLLSRQDKEVVVKLQTEMTHKVEARQQGEYESLHRDMMVGFGKWEFDPMDLENPFPNNEGSVHLWHGDEDGLVPITLQRYVAQRLPWVQFHELPGSGHLFGFVEGLIDTIMRTALTESCNMSDC